MTQTSGAQAADASAGTAGFRGHTRGLGALLWKVSFLMNHVWGFLDCRQKPDALASSLPLRTHILTARPCPWRVLPVREAPLQTFVPPQSGGWRLRPRRWQLGPPEPLSLAGRRPSCPHVLTQSSLSARLCPQPPSYEDTRRIGLGPTLVTSFYLRGPCEDPASKHGHVQRTWG